MTKGYERVYDGEIAVVSLAMYSLARVPPLGCLLSAIDSILLGISVCMTDIGGDHLALPRLDSQQGCPCTEGSERCDYTARTVDRKAPLAPPSCMEDRAASPHHLTMKMFCERIALAQRTPGPDPHTLARGSHVLSNTSHSEHIFVRLRRIEGHVRGLQRIN